MKEIQRKLGLRDSEMSNLLIAFEQMKAKGFVTMEDFIRQVGEVLPGSLHVLSETLNLKINETVRQIKLGKVKSDVLDKFIIEYKKMLN
jgi:tape measure domain-containing protein